MKKRILGFLLILVMIMGTVQGTMAEEVETVRYYKGTVEYNSDILEVDAVLRGGYLETTFVTGNGDNVILSSKPGAWLDNFHSVSTEDPAWAKVNGILASCIGSYCGEAGDEIYWFGKGDAPGANSADDRGYSFSMSLYEVDPPKDPVHEIVTPLLGTAESDRGDYSLSIAGQYVDELTDGTHELTAEEITSQTMAIVAYNKANGVKRVMRENTIEEMTVTVLDGQVTECVIRGRVQTDGGKLDRYTATILAP